MLNQQTLLSQKSTTNGLLVSQNSIDHLRLVLDNTEEILLVFNTDLTITIYNKAAAKYIKDWVQRDIVQGMHLEDITPGNLLANILPVYHLALQGQSHTFEEEVKKEQDILVFRSTIKPALNENGEVAGIISITQDITEQRLKEKALKAFEERWRFALEKSNHGLWEWNIQTGAVKYSESYKDLLGFSDADLNGHIDTWRASLHPDDVLKAEEAIKRHTDSAEPFFETVYRLKDKRGHYRWIHARGMIINKGKQGVPLLMIGSHTDITLQKEAEEQYKTLFFNHPIPMWIFEPATWKILEVNEAAQTFYGYSRDEFLSFTLYDLRPTDQHEELEKMLRALDINQIQKNTAQHVKKNGELFWAEFTGNHIQFNGTSSRLVSVVDITASVLAKQELKKSNERFQLAAQAASEALWEWDIQNDQVYISPVYIDMFGFDIDVKRKYAEWHDYIHPEDQEETIAGFYAAIQDPAIDHWEHEYRYLKSDGSYMPVVDRCVIKRDETGKATKAVGAIQDVSKRKKAEEDLKVINERFKLATKATSDAIYDWDVASGELVWGEGITSLFGYRSQDVSFDAWEEFIHPADRRRIIQSLDFATNHSKKKFWKEQYRFRKSDGTYSYVLDRGFVVRGEEGKPLRLIGAMQDISDIKLKERELLKSNDRYKYASLATSEIIWDWNLVKGTILWSDNYEKVFGWELPENRLLADTTCLQKFHPDDKDRVWNSLQAAVQSEGNNLWHEEFRYLKSDNTYAYVSDKGYVIRNAEGEAIRMIGAMEDISPKKYADALLKLEQKTFELNARNNSCFNEVIETLLQGFEELHPAMYTSVLLLTSSQTMQPVASPRLPYAYKDGIQGVQIGPFEGSCGAAMFHKKNIIVPDISIDPHWKKYKDFAAQFDLKAAWSFPILNRGGEVMGSLVIYHKSLQIPAPEEIPAIERIRDLLRILMENHLALDKIKAANKRFDSVMQATNDLIWDWDLETGSFYRDKEGIKRVYGVNDELQISNIHSWMQRVHPEEHEGVQRVINDILNSGDEKFFDLEYRFRRDDGEYNYVYDRGYLIRNSEGKPVRMVGAAQNISDRKRLEKQLLQRELEKQKLIGQATIETQEQERSEIGKELHDNVNQVLTTTKLYLDLSVSNPEMKDDLINKSSKNIIYVINEIRQLSRSLMNPSLGDLGLVDALKDLIENINLTRKLKVDLETSIIEDLLPESAKVTLFRIVQEALNNALKHAKAQSVIITLSGDAEEVTLKVTDDGVGFEPHNVRRGAGLKNIQNRVYLANGSLQLQSTPGNGCSIIINVPLHNKTINTN